MVLQNQHVIHVLAGVICMMFLGASSCNGYSDSVTFTGWGSGQVGGSLDVAGQVDYHMIVIEEGVKGVMRATTVATNDEDGNGSLDDEVGIVWYSDTGGMPYYPENGSQVHDIFTLARCLTPGTYYIIAQAKYLDYGISGSYSIQLDFSEFLPPEIHGVYVHLYDIHGHNNTPPGWFNQSGILEISLFASSPDNGLITSYDWKGSPRLGLELNEEDYDFADDDVDVGTPIEVIVNASLTTEGAPCSYSIVTYYCGYGKAYVQSSDGNVYWVNVYSAPEEIAEFPDGP